MVRAGKRMGDLVKNRIDHLPLGTQGHEMAGQRDPAAPKVGLASSADRPIPGECPPRQAVLSHKLDCSALNLR